MRDGGALPPARTAPGSLHTHANVIEYDVSITRVNRRNDVQRSRAHRENCEYHVTFLL